MSRQVLLPNVRSFTELFEYLGEWDFRTDNSRDSENRYNRGVRYIPVETPRATAHERASWRTDHGRNEIGPYCNINLSQIGGTRSRSIAVRATDLVIEAVEERIVTPDDHLSFKLIAHKEPGTVLVILDHNYILGSIWLARIDPNTIPNPDTDMTPIEQRWAEQTPTSAQWAELVRAKGEFDGYDDEGNLIIISHNSRTTEGQPVGFTIAPNGEIVGISA